jgi:uncharacterized protein (TIGR01370 family)
MTMARWLSLSVLLALPAASPLGDVRTFMYQFQRMEESSAVDALAASPYDLLIVEPVGTYRSGQNVDMKALVGRLRGKKTGRLVFAYLNLAEADSHRAYWESSWKSPARGRPGRPDFLVGPDPDGWEDTFVVRYWDPRWRDLLLADLRKILAGGFDGVCLDWADAYENAALVAQARTASVSAAREMVDLVAKVRSTALEVNPRALLLLQNPSGLGEEDPRLIPLADAVLYEHTWYSGKAEVGWSDDRGGDLANHSPDADRIRETRLAQMAKWKKEQKPVLTLDYCLKPEHAREVYERSLGLGYVPLVSRSALDRLTETPPPGLR